MPSVDRACLRAASVELRSSGLGGGGGDVGTGMDRAWNALMVPTLLVDGDHGCDDDYRDSEPVVSNAG